MFLTTVIPVLSLTYLQHLKTRGITNNASNINLFLLISLLDLGFAVFLDIMACVLVIA